MPFSAVGGAILGGVASAATSSLMSGGGGGGGSSGAAAAADPFAGQRGQYQTMLSSLINNPSSVTSLPGYQFQLQQGLSGVQGGMAAAGFANSGNVLSAMTKYGEDYASTAYTNQALMLAQLAGANIGSPGTAGQILQGQNQLNQQAAGVLGNQVGGAVSQGINSLFSGGGYTSGGNPFATDTSGFGAGANSYGFSSGVSDPSFGVGYGFGV